MGAATSAMYPVAVEINGIASVTERFSMDAGIKKASRMNARTRPRFQIESSPRTSLPSMTRSWQCCRLQKKRKQRNERESWLYETR
jgi:hypothetical protein